VPEQDIILDTGPLVAFLGPQDPHHRWAVAQFEQLPEPFVTCEAVLSEAFFLLQRVHGGTGLLLDFLGTGILVSDFNMLTELPALDPLLRKYADAPMALADACLVRLAELHPRACVFTLDRHFRMYRKNGRQKIPVIMPDDVG